MARRVSFSPADAEEQRQAEILKGELLAIAEANSHLPEADLENLLCVCLKNRMAMQKGSEVKHSDVRMPPMLALQDSMRRPSLEECEAIWEKWWDCGHGGGLPWSSEAPSTIHNADYRSHRPVDAAIDSDEYDEVTQRRKTEKTEKIKKKKKKEIQPEEEQDGGSEKAETPETEIPKKKKKERQVEDELEGGSEKIETEQPKKKKERQEDEEQERGSENTETPEKPKKKKKERQEDEEQEGGSEKTETSDKRKKKKKESQVDEEQTRNKQVDEEPKRKETPSPKKKRGSMEDEPTSETKAGTQLKIMELAAVSQVAKFNGRDYLQPGHPCTPTYHETRVQQALEDLSAVRIVPKFGGQDYDRPGVHAPQLSEA